MNKLLGRTRCEVDCTIMNSSLLGAKLMLLKGKEEGGGEEGREEGGGESINA